MTSRGDCLPLTSVTAQGRPSRLSRARASAEEEEGEEESKRESEAGRTAMFRW